MKSIARRLFCGLSVGATFALKRAVAQTTGDTDALVKAAQAEGEFTCYTAATDNVSKRVGDAFAAKYGVHGRFLRLGSAPMIQRYSAESEAGNPAADLVLIAGGAVAFVKDGIAKGWFEPIDRTGLPVLASFPADYLRFGGAIVQIAPWKLVYNTDRVKPAEVPKTWQDLLTPRFKGRILLTDPKAADSFLDVWAAVADAFGPSWFAAMRAQNPRWYSDGVPTVQALAAGEGDVTVPLVEFVAQLVKEKGAPVDTVLLSPTSGVEMYAALTGKAKGKAPNAARLFVNFLMSPDGNRLFNRDPGSYSVYDRAQLPQGYVSPDPNTPKRRDEIRGLFGLQ